jgi:hypothetical protein
MNAYIQVCNVACSYSPVLHFILHVIQDDERYNDVYAALKTAAAQFKGQFLFVVFDANSNRKYDAYICINAYINIPYG